MTEHGPVVTAMIVVGDVPAAIDFYRTVLNARERWRLGDGVACLDVEDAHLLLSKENTSNQTLTPTTNGAVTARMELFVDDPDDVIARAAAAGATGTHMEDHQRPWGRHRQGAFHDPWGQVCLVGDRGPITASPQA